MKCVRYGKTAANNWIIQYILYIDNNTFTDGAECFDNFRSLRDFAIANSINLSSIERNDY